MINASAVNAITSSENEKVKWWEKNGIVTVKIKDGITYAINEVLAEGAPPSITGERYKVMATMVTSSTTRGFWIDPDGKIIAASGVSTAQAVPAFGMYQC